MAAYGNNQKPSLLTNNSNDWINKMTIPLMFFGGAIVGVGVLGFIAVNFSIKLISTIYKFLLALFGVMLLVTGVAAVVVTYAFIEFEVQDMINMMKKDRKSKEREKMNEIEKTHKCCGVAGHMDLYKKSFVSLFPDSCCIPFNVPNTCISLRAHKLRCNEVWFNPRDEFLVYAGVLMSILVSGATIAYLGWEAKKYDNFFTYAFEPVIARICSAIFVFGIAVGIIGIIGLTFVKFRFPFMYSIYKIPLLGAAAVVIFIMGVLSFVAVDVVQVSERRSMVAMMTGEKERSGMDDIEFFNDCCGVSGKMDLYELSQPGPSARVGYPETCCPFAGYDAQADFMRQSVGASHKYVCLRPCNADLAHKRPCDKFYIHPFQYLLMYLANVLMVVSVFLAGFSSITSLYIPLTALA
ncbi:hypothetical protein GE061_007526 [Apolygus lucorum]|uniref:Tetraspanin n=1 Tax=Apolygus lucorum TaxID=248454 RepID=A0A8S9WRE5_APOLU|nr:hypothetical protein GE061_007526 [Apolygus lucorum]